MTTIKERATESLAKWDDNIYFHHSELTEDAYKDGYIEGAKDQKKIDEDAIHAIVEERVIKAVGKQKKIDIDNACKCYCDHICDIGRSCMCYHKHDDKGQIKKTFKYNECSELKLIRREMK